MLYDSSHDYLFQSDTEQRLPTPVKTDLSLSLLELQAIALLFLAYPQPLIARYHVLHHVSYRYAPSLMEHTWQGMSRMTVVSPKESGRA